MANANRYTLLVTTAMDAERHYLAINIFNGDVHYYSLGGLAYVYINGIKRVLTDEQHNYYWNKTIMNSGIFFRLKLCCIVDE